MRALAHSGAAQNINSGFYIHIQPNQPKKIKVGIAKDITERAIGLYTTKTVLREEHKNIEEALTMNGQGQKMSFEIKLAHKHRVSET